MRIADQMRALCGRSAMVTGRLAVVLAIARMEWYFQRRSAAFWVVMTLIGGLGIYLIVRPQATYAGDTPLALWAYSWWIPLVLLPVLIAALLWRTMHRDRQGAGNIVLTRPVGAGAWVLGKTLGALFAVTMLYLAAYVMAYAILSVQHGTALALNHNLLSLIIFWLAPLAVDVVLYLLLDALVAVPLLAIIPYLIMAIGFNAWLYVWPGQPFLGLEANFTLAYVVFVGNEGLAGPYRDLLLGSCLLWLGILCAMGVLLALCHRWRCRQIAWTRACTFWIAVLALIAGGSMTPGIVLNDAAMARLAPYASPMMPAAPLSTIAVSDYQASISLLPDTSNLRGTVIFTVSSTSAQANVQAVLQFTHDPGLTVDSVVQGTRRLPLSHQRGLTGATLSGRLPQTLRLAYHGTLQPLWQGYGGWQPRGFDSELSSPVDSFDRDDAIGPDFTVLTSTGSWYPVPQVQNVLHLIQTDNLLLAMVPADVHWTNLAITLPNQHTVFSSALSTSSHGGTTTFLWQHPAGGLLPGALLAACPSCKSRSAPSGRYVAAASIGDETARRDYAPLVAAYAAVRRIMDGPRASDPVTVVAVPMLAQSVGGGALVFVPEAAWDGMQPVWQERQHAGVASLSALQRQRIAISAAAAAWWAGNTQWLASSMQYPYENSGVPLLSYSGEHSPYATVVAELAARLVLGDAYFRREQQLRSAYQSRIERDIANLVSRGKHFDLATAPAYVREAATLGLLAENQYFYESYLTGAIARAGTTHVEALLQMARRQQPSMQCCLVEDMNQATIARDYAFLQLPPPKAQ